MAYEISREQFTHEGRTFEVAIFSDDDNGAPWERSEGHGPVRRVSGAHRCQDAGKRAGERPMNDPDRHCWQFLYDWQGALQMAKRDGWGLTDADRAALAARLGRTPTRGDIRAEAVRRDFEFLAGWARSDWEYVGVSVRIIGADGEPEGEDYSHALWGVESCGDYWRDVARELAGEILYEKGKAWRAALKEARARKYWASRDVITAGA